MDPVGNQLDLSSDALPRGGNRPGSESDGQPFLGVHFQCCGVYGRVYRSRDADAYRGRCPRCLGQIEVGIGPGGSSSRFFSAS